MDAGSYTSVSSEKMRSRMRYRAPLREVGSTVFIPPLRSSSLRNPLSRQSSADRFIPDRSAMDFDYAHYALTESRKEKENNSSATASPSKEAYRKLLAEILLNNRTRILAFKSKPPTPTDGFLSGTTSDPLTSSSHLTKPKQRRYISQTAERTLDAPDLVDDYYLRACLFAPKKGKSKKWKTIKSKNCFGSVWFAKKKRRNQRNGDELSHYYRVM